MRRLVCNCYGVRVSNSGNEEDVQERFRLTSVLTVDRRVAVIFHAPITRLLKNLTQIYTYMYQSENSHPGWCFLQSPTLNENEAHAS